MTASAGQTPGNQLYTNKFQHHLRPTLFSIMELALALFLAHTICYLHKLNIRTHPEIVQQITANGVDLVHSLDSYLVDMRSDFKEEALVMVRQVFIILADLLHVTTL
jgi:hypothetical protein